MDEKDVRALVSGRMRVDLGLGSSQLGSNRPGCLDLVLYSYIAYYFQLRAFFSDGPVSVTLENDSWILCRNNSSAQDLLVISSVYISSAIPNSLDVGLTL